jgi:hypothetical protein
MADLNPSKRLSAGEALLEWHRLRGEIHEFSKELRPLPHEKDIMGDAWDLNSLSLLFPM